MDRNGLDDAALEALFREAREAAPAPLDGAFAARLLAAAEAARRPAARRGWWSRLTAALAEIGGAPGVAGVGVAGLAGLWIGFAGPGMTDDLVAQVLQGAASVGGPVSTLIEGDPLGVGADDTLLGLMSLAE